MKKRSSRFLSILLAVLCTLPLAVSCGKDGENAPSSDTDSQSVSNEADTGSPSAPQMKDPSVYYAPKKEAEVYDPEDTRELKIHGISTSDGDYAAVYGECPIGTTVHIKNAYGEFSVLSEGGCFAARVLNPDPTAALEVSLSYNGEAVGDVLQWTGDVMVSSQEEVWAVFLGGENQGFYHQMVPDFIGANVLTDSLLQLTESRWASRVDRLKEIGDGCEIICVLVPSPMTVYPELVPKEAVSHAINCYYPQYADVESSSDITRFDQISQMLTNAGVTVIDMRKTFEEHKNDALPLYFNYDTHWSEYGSYLAYVELYRHISEKFPAAVPHSFDEFSWDGGYYTGGDISGYFNLNNDRSIVEYAYKRNMLFDSVPEVESFVRYKSDDDMGYNAFSSSLLDGGVYHTGREELPDIYVIRNSYGASIHDLMLERSNNAVFQPMFSYTFNIAEIEEAAPDYLIYVYSEWKLEKLIEN
ncbi:MAG: hypothetical protein IJC98_06375 [Clostridia bacterium]|nr:hypothetical protein [Clostridia bacterium]